MMKTLHLCLTGALFLAVLSLTGCCLWPPPPPPRTVRTVRIYTEVEYELVKERRRPFPNITETRRETLIGSGFLCDGRIVTARHVLFGPDPASIARLGDLKVGAGEYAIASRRIRINISDLVYEPEGVWASPTTDIAVLKLPEDAIHRLGLKPFSISRRAPQEREQISVWGFPGNTSAPQMTEYGANGNKLRVTAVFDEYLVLNGPLESGYSGGPVLAGENEDLLGLVSRSEERQSRVLRIGFSPSKVSLSPYEKGMLLDPVEQLIRSQ